MRNYVLNFVFELLEHADPAAKTSEVISLLGLFAEDSFDDLCVMDLCNRLTTLAVDDLALLKETSLPQYLIYFLFNTNRDTPLSWSSKVAMLTLLDSVMNQSQVLVDLILSVGIMVNNSLKNIMEHLFNLIDSYKTVEFGAALIIDIILTATNCITSFLC